MTYNSPPAHMRALLGAFLSTPDGAVCGLGAEALGDLDATDVKHPGGHPRRRDEEVILPTLPKLLPMAPEWDTEGMRDKAHGEGPRRPVPPLLTAGRRAGRHGGP